MRLASRCSVAAAALLVLGGCETGIRVGIDADDNGGGRVVAVVTLDPSAQRVAGDLTGRLRVADLTRAGWKVEGPTKVGRDVRVTASKQYASSAGAARAVDELDGASEMFSAFAVTQERSLLRTTTRVRATVDLRGGINAFSDDALAEVLGSPLGATPEEFAARIGKELSAALPVTVGVTLPGEIDSNAPTQSHSAAAWHPKLGERITIEATAKKWNTTPIVLGAVALLAAATAIVVGIRGR